jgi:hypothetical protein
MPRKFVFASALVAALFIPAGSGIAQNAGPVHKGAWPIYDWRNHQPTEDELEAMHDRDVSRAQAREIDQLYDQLMSSSQENLERRPALP